MFERRSREIINFEQVNLIHDQNKIKKEYKIFERYFKFGRHRDKDYRKTSASHNKRVKEGGEAATIR
jgi:hypothetical protein